MRPRRLFLAFALLVLAPLAAVAWWLGSPLVLDKAVEEEFPLAATALVPESMTRAEVEAVMGTMAKLDQEMLEAAAQGMDSAAVIKRGEFRDADSFHKGSGAAIIYRLPDGTHVLRLEDFRVTNGPDLHVLLVKHADPRGREDVKAQGDVDLGKLKGNIGSQNYPIPNDIDPAALNSVVIYCKPFSVIFSVAPLSDAG